MSEHLHQLEWNNKIAVAVSLAEVQNDRRLSNLVYCFNDPIYEYSLKMFMRNDFPYINELNQFIQQAMDSGLILKWLKGYQFGSSIKRSEKTLYEYMHNHEALMLLIVFCCLLLSLAFFMWIIEKIVHKKVCTQNSALIWKYIEMMIDPYRHYWNHDLSHY